MNNNTLILVAAVAIGVYLWTKKSVSVNVSAPSANSSVPLTAQQQLAQIQWLEPQVNPSAAAELSYAAADVAIPNYITGGVVHQVSPLIGLGGWV